MIRQPHSVLVLNIQNKCHKPDLWLQWPLIFPVALRALGDFHRELSKIRDII